MAAGVVYLPANVKISTLDEWVRWAGGYAERVDPLRGADDAIDGTDAAQGQ